MCCPWDEYEKRNSTLVTVLWVGAVSESGLCRPAHTEAYLLVTHPLALYRHLSSFQRNPVSDLIQDWQWFDSFVEFAKAKVAFHWHVDKISCLPILWCLFFLSCLYTQIQQYGLHSGGVLLPAWPRMVSSSVGITPDSTTICVCTFTCGFKFTRSKPDRRGAMISTHLCYRRLE